MKKASTTTHHAGQAATTILLAVAFLGLVMLLSYLFITGNQVSCRCPVADGSRYSNLCRESPPSRTKTKGRSLQNRPDRPCDGIMRALLRTRKSRRLLTHHAIQIGPVLLCADLDFIFSCVDQRHD